MKEKRVSFCQGKGSLAHDNREFLADNVDPLRTPQNITFVRQPIGEAYDQLFKASTERYNTRQKRNDRKVAKKEVTSKKQTKKLRKERDDAVQECDALKAKLSAVSSELAAYKKAEEQKGLFTRDKLKKAQAFISACELNSDYQQFKYNSTARKNVLE